MITKMLIQIAIWASVWFAIGLAPAASAGELEFRKTDVDVEWGKYGTRMVTAYQAGYTHYTEDNYGFGVMTGQSNRAEKDGRSVSMKDFWVFVARKKLHIYQGVSATVGLTYTEYQSCTGWGCNADTSHGYELGIQQRYNSAISYKLTYNNYYEKYKKGLGKERTHGVGISLIYGY